ncbi:MAG: helix-turn-helix domain-containing protein [Methylococcales symbiont of Iophon sp. n. MRB-2018]|nr:MAG: helix-turn-helix domain-containing protein [Methylococcales symbiont of Iophon sp. n. MRB-2018]KAF3979224.1 MAG: helix-turn-helix domain-containing protein [Methylococcales symbiont of Iophon sp. n. MRB-2018]
MITAFSEISAGLTEAINHAKGEETKVIEHVAKDLNVKAIRETTGMSQQKFCATFGISVGTLRNWEQGLRSPRGTARVLLQVVKHNPAAIIEAIQH